MIYLLLFGEKRFCEADNFKYMIILKIEITV